MKGIFDRFNKDNSGFISKENLKQIIQDDKAFGNADVEFTTSEHNRPTRNSYPFEYSIFCSDMVSDDFIRGKLNELEFDTKIVHVELEDCLVASKFRMEIPDHLKDILALSDRSWEGIGMVDELLDGWCYPEFQASREQFVEALGTQEEIPVTFRTTIQLTDDEDGEEGEASLTQILQEFQKDSGIVKLTLTTSETSVTLLQALTDLLQCDDRDWDDVILQLTTDGEELSPELKEAMERLQEVSKTKRVTGPCLS